VQTLVVPRRFRGPTHSANGGYFCGLVAALVPHPATVRLVRPPPLDTPLTVVENAGIFEVRHGDTVIAAARHGTVGELDPSPPPTPAQAEDAAKAFKGFHTHPAPECFVCGPERAAGDALRIFCGALPDGRSVAAPWTPNASLAGDDGQVRRECLWAALDCPGFAAAAPDMRSMLLGELTARIDAPVHVGEPCVVVGWAIAASGRKHEAGTALYGPAGDLRAVARAVWIEPRS
jgi:hypothetical protein